MGVMTSHDLIKLDKKGCHEPYSHNSCGISSTLYHCLPNKSEALHFKLSSCCHSILYPIQVQKFLCIDHLSYSLEISIHFQPLSQRCWFVCSLQHMDDAPYMLEEAVNSLPCDSSTVMLQLLTSVMKVFFKRAPECQEMLGRLLEHCISRSQVLAIMTTS